MIALFTLLTFRLPASPSDGSVASWLHVTGPAGLPGFSFAGAGDTINATPSTTAVSHSPARAAIVFPARHVGTCAAAAASLKSAGATAARIPVAARRIVIIVPPLGG